MRILIAADLVPTKSNFNLFNNADIEELLGKDLLNIWNGADIRIFNLEVPITDQPNPIKKCGPNLICPTSTIKGIRALNPNLITLANNHILDQGEEGLESTIDILNRNNIQYIGAGKNIEELRKNIIIKKNGLKLGIYNCAEREFSIATKYNSGANPFDPLEILDEISELKKSCDYLVVIYHGGKEHYRYPSPDLQKSCRKLVEKGADLIVCQHSHCIGCFEDYNNSTIIYGQGNFIFDNSESEYWQTSLLVSIDLDNKISINYYPITKKGNVIRLANGKTESKILEDFKSRSNEILDEKFIERKYNEFSKDNINTYIKAFSGMSKCILRIDKYVFRSNFLRKRFTKQKLLAIKNFIECQAHRELVVNGINCIIEEGEK